MSALARAPAESLALNFNRCIISGEKLFFLAGLSIVMRKMRHRLHPRYPRQGVGHRRCSRRHPLVRRTPA